MISVQVKADAGSTPCCGSVALPPKAIASPTRQTTPVPGELIVAVGGVFPALILTEAMSKRPSDAVTRSRTMWSPAS